MQAGTVAVAGYAEAIVDAEVDVSGATYTLRPRDPDSGRLGTVVKTTTALYTAETAAFTALILPVDWVP
jgi:hypothetical protein